MTEESRRLRTAWLPPCFWQPSQVTPRFLALAVKDKICYLSPRHGGGEGYERVDCSTCAVGKEGTPAGPGGPGAGRGGFLRGCRHLRKLGKPAEVGSQRHELT